MVKKINKMDIKEFREKGYLQELNRMFLHPLGLALEVQIDEEGNESLGGIWDYRNDKEGIHYALNDPKVTDAERLKAFAEKAKLIAKEFDDRVAGRVGKLGFFAEPIPKEVNE